MIALGINELTAGYVQDFVTTYIPGLLVYCYNDSLDIFLAATGYTSVIFLVQCFILPVHFVTCYYFVHSLRMELVGAAFATLITTLLTLIFTLAYAIRLPELNDAWFYPTHKSIENLGQYLKLALPGILMLTIETLNMESIVIFTGAYFKDTNSIAA